MSEINKPAIDLSNADFSHLEDRIAAAARLGVVGGIDIHAETAEQIFGVPKEQVTAEQRLFAKTLNYRRLYDPNFDGSTLNPLKKG